MRLAASISSSSGNSISSKNRPSWGSQGGRDPVGLLKEQRLESRSSGLRGVEPDPPVGLVDRRIGPERWVGYCQKYQICEVRPRNSG
jgi:hypothetical protein